jgi:two-component system sensor histidine kinase/response regulator
MNKINYEVFVLDNSRPEALRLKLDDPSFPVHLLVVLDEQELDGISLVKTLHDYKLTDRMLVYLISANHKPANYVLSKRYGVDYYFSEPFEQSDLTAGFHESFPLLEKVSHESVRKIRPDLSILLAEDNEINIRVAQTIFTSIGYNIDVARNGKEAVEKVKNKPYDIVFMDLVMPEMDGLQATIEIRGSGQQLPIIAMTATASSKSKSRAISTGMNDYIVKPVKTDVIRNILLKWFA